MRSPIVDPDLRSPSGFDFGLRPPLRMTRRGGSGVPRLVRLALGDSDLRSPSGFDFGLSPSAQEDTERRKWGAEVGALGVRRSRPAVALRVRLRASPFAQDDTERRKCSARVCVLGVRRSRPAVALRVRLRASPSAQDDTEAEIFARSLGLRRITGVIF